MKKYLIVFAVVLLALAITGCKKEQAATKAPANDPGFQQQPSQTAPKKVGPPTYVAEGKTPEDHVNEYYNAYKNQELEKAFELAPAEQKAKQPKDQFIELKKGMPISDFKVNPTESPNDNTKLISVEFDIERYGTWVSQWEFQKKDGKWIALRYRSGVKQ